MKSSKIAFWKMGDGRKHMKCYNKVDSNTVAGGGSCMSTLNHREEGLGDYFPKECKGEVSYRESSTMRK